MSDTFQLTHEIFILDTYLKRRLNCANRERITRDFIDDFLSVLGLEPLGQLGVFPAVDKRAPGWSFIQAITTSHISAHYFEKPGRLPHFRIDAYSCESINWRALIGVCDQHFALSEWRASFIDREIELDRRRTVLDLAGVGSTVTMDKTLSAFMQATSGGKALVAAPA